MRKFFLLSLSLILSSVSMTGFASGKGDLIIRGVLTNHNECFFDVNYNSFKCTKTTGSEIRKANISAYKESKNTDKLVSVLYIY